MATNLVAPNLMPTSLLDELTSGFGKELSGQAGKFLGESDNGITSALGSLMPTLVGSLAQKASTPSGASELYRLVNGANIDTRLLGHLGGLFAGGERTNALTSLGGTLAPALLGGDKVGALAAALAAVVGIKSGSARTLLLMAVPLLFAFLKKHIAENRVDAAGLANLLLGQRSALERAHVEPGITKALGYGSLATMLASLGAGASESALQVAGTASRAAHETAGATRYAARETRSGLLRWWPWLLGLAALGLLWSFLRTGESPPAPVASPQVTAPAPPATRAPAPAGPVVSGGLPAKVYFETGSFALDGDATGAIARAVTEIKVSDAKIDVTGYTDKTGNVAANEELARNRARAVRDALIAAGVPQASITMKPPVFVTGSGADAEARRVEIKKSA